MFFKCISLNSIELSNFDTKNVKNMECMFYSCYSLINLDLSNFDFNKVTNIKYMFKNCHSLIALNIPKLNIKNKNINKEQIFHGCNSLINKCISENE